jgi:hypothetical protein
MMGKQALLRSTGRRSRERFSRPATKRKEEDGYF